MFTACAGISQMITVEPCQHGLGVFSTRTIEAGETIASLWGIRIAKHYSTFPPFGVDSFYDNLIQVGEGAYLVVTDSLQRLNHSCAPNAGISEMKVIALSRIAPHEEICFDYATTIDEGGLWQMPCSCGTAACRGVVGDFCRLPRHLQEHYVARGIVMPFLVRKYFPVFAKEKVREIAYQA